MTNELPIYEVTTFQLSTDTGYVIGFKREGVKAHLFPRESVELILDSAKRLYHWEDGVLHIITAYGPVFQHPVLFSLDDGLAPLQGYQLLKAHCHAGFRHSGCDYVLPVPKDKWVPNGGGVWPMSMKALCVCDFCGLYLEFSALKHPGNVIEMISLYTWRERAGSKTKVLIDALNGDDMKARVRMVETA